MKALVLREIKTPLAIEERPDLQPRGGEAVVQLHAAALNRRDFWITRGLYPGIRTPVILGSDGAGTVTRIGDGVDAGWVGRDVVINPALDWGSSPAAQAGDFRILGMPDDGTFATEVVIPATQLAPKPGHLDWPEAAALPLAGLTAYRALFVQGRLASAERVLITGIGGGVATFALAFAVSSGATAIVTSSSREKIERAVNLGAAQGFDYRSEGWARRLLAQHGPMDLIIDGSGGPGFADLIDVAAPGGRIVSYGSTAGAPERLDLFKVFWKQLHLVGSTMGSPADFQAMLALVGRARIKPVVDKVAPLSDGRGLVESMKSSPQFGKLVLRTTGA